MRALILVLLAGFVLPAYAAEMDDNLIIPGERVGFITQQTTEAALQKRLPPEQLKRVLVDIGEGTVRCATEVFSGTEKAVVIIWGSNTTLYEPYKNESVKAAEEKRCATARPMTNLEFVLIDKTNSPWRLQGGGGIGAPLEELERANGAPVSFAFGEFCGSGNVSNWHDGKFSGSRYKEFSSNILNLHLGDHGVDSESPFLKKYRAKNFENIKSSDLPPALKKQFYVDRLDVYLQKDAPLPKTE